MKLFCRQFGCEFEFSSSFEKVNEIAKEAVDKVYGKGNFFTSRRCYSSVNNTSWQMKTEPSTSCELVTPVSRIKDIPRIKRVLKEIARQKPKLTQADGFHVHMYAGDCNQYKILSAWLQIEKPFSRCFPRHRRSNGSCAKLDIGGRKKNGGKLADYFMEALDVADSHDVALSVSDFLSRETIEFRMGEGTVDGETVEMFVRFYMLFLNYASTIDPIPILCEPGYRMTNLEAVLYMINVQSYKMGEFFRSRHFRYNGY